MQDLKDNRPVIDEHYIRPASAEKLMKSAHTARQTLYISGPNGFGKSSLVVDMLARRRYYYFQSGDIDGLLAGIDEVL